MFELEWFPKAYAIGISWDDFWKMNPHILKIMLEGHREKTRHEISMHNSLFHLQGQYFAHAINATVGNMFKKKGSKNQEYPKKPFDISSQNEINEEELQKQRELFLAKLMVMQSNFENSKNDRA